jgi:hypothetical protein
MLLSDLNTPWDVETNRRDRLRDLAPFESWGLSRHPFSWHLRAGGAVHSINSGRNGSNKRAVVQAPVARLRS